MKRIKLNESQLRSLIVKTVKKAINEDYGMDLGREKAWGDAQFDAAADADYQEAVQYIMNNKNRFEALVSYFNAAMKIIGEIDPAYFPSWSSNEVDWLLDDMHRFLEDNASKIQLLIKGGPKELEEFFDWVTKR